jgi:hypothetical protein
MGYVKSRSVAKLDEYSVIKGLHWVAMNWCNSSCDTADTMFFPEILIQTMQAIAMALS